MHTKYATSSKIHPDLRNRSFSLEQYRWDFGKFYQFQERVEHRREAIHILRIDSRQWKCLTKQNNP